VFRQKYNTLRHFSSLKPLLESNLKPD